MNQTPTIKELYENISNDLRNKLELSDDELKKVLNALSSSLSGQFKLVYLLLEDAKNQVFPDKADTFENGGTLDRQGLIQLNRIRRPAASGVFQISILSEAQSVLRSGITFKSNDESLNPGKVYILDTQEEMTGDNDLVEIRSIDGGSDVSLLVGDTLTITEPVIGVEQVVTVTSIVEPPISEESIDDYRQAIINSRQLEPQGGSKTDYRLWSDDAAGVRLVYPYVKDGEAGTVQVYTEATKEDSLDGNGTPTQTILDSLRDALEFNPDETKPISERGRRPITAILEVLPITVNPVDITITGLSDSSQSIRDSISENLKDYLFDVRPFVAGGDLLRNKNDILYSAKLQSVVTDVIDSSNFFVEFIVFVNGVAQNSFLFSRENIPYLRNLTFN